MGLKTTNYQLSNFDTVLPTAYAIIDEIIVERNSVSVTFGIYASRQKASNYKPLETKTVHFVWDRKSDIAVMAYNVAKNEVITESLVDGKSKTHIIKGCLYGWQDDKI